MALFGVDCNDRYDKIFFQGVKKMEKEKGKREIGDNGMRKEREV